MVLRFAFLLSILSGSAKAFSVDPKPPKGVSTKLFLKPSQGSHLAAAWEASCNKEDHEERASVSPALSSPVTAGSAARAFVSRVFSLPSSLLHPTDDGKDVVYYPIVGFQLVGDGAGHCAVLPTTARASCRIPASQTEILVGWFSSACFVDDAKDDCLLSKF